MTTSSVKSRTNALPAPLPMRDGVAPSYVWLPPGTWPTVMAFLLERFPAIDRATWERRMAGGDVLEANGREIQHDTPYRANLQVFYYREIEDEVPVPFEEKILFRDAHLLVVDKPHFLAVTPGGRFLQQSLLVRLRRTTGLTDLAPIHRLDRETAGVVAFSVCRADRGAYQALFRERSVEKIYEALAGTDPTLALPCTRESRIVESERFFVMQEVNGEPNARTGIELIERRGDHGLYRLRPVTGKTHQLRVHMNALGLPILNDLLYPVAQAVGVEDMTRPLKLLARSLSFIDPFSGVRHQFHSEREL